LLSHACQGALRGRHGELFAHRQTGRQEGLQQRPAAIMFHAIAADRARS
jgi:hypothetical protein